MRSRTEINEVIKDLKQQTNSGTRPSFEKVIFWLKWVLDDGAEKKKSKCPTCGSDSWEEE